MSSLMSPLSEALEAGTVLPFIGDNLPRSITGFPSRADLARGLAQRHKVDESLSLAAVAQRVGRSGGRFAFTDFLRQALDSSGQTPSPFYSQVVALVQRYRLRTVVTTSYADLLEAAFRQAETAVHRIVNDSDVAFISPNRPSLIKLYGDLQQPDTLVVTDSDHYALLRDPNKQELLETLRQAFRLNNVLFLGYDLSDPNFRFLFDQVAQRRFARTAFAVWPGLPADEQVLWHDQGIIILDQEPRAILKVLVSGAESPDQTVEEADPLPQEETSLEHPSWDKGTIRSLLTTAFNDAELTAFCFDHYTAVYENFGEGTSKSVKIQQLLDYCYRRNAVDDLLALVKQYNPWQFGRFAPQGKNP
jgi:hypothetical protein